MLTPYHIYHTNHINIRHGGSARLMGEDLHACMTDLVGHALRSLNDVTSFLCVGVIERHNHGLTLISDRFASMHHLSIDSIRPGECGVCQAYSSGKPCGARYTREAVRASRGLAPRFGGILGSSRRRARKTARPRYLGKMNDLTQCCILQMALSELRRKAVRIGPSSLTFSKSFPV